MDVSNFEDSSIGGEVVRLIEEGFVDGLVRKLQAKNPGADHEVEDAVATAVLRLVTRSNDGKPVEDVAGYLYAAARNGVYDAHRHRQRFSEFDLETHDSPDDAADHDLLQKEALRALQRLVKAWPNRNVRECTLLYLDSVFYGEPLTLVDAAAQLSDLFGETVSVASIGTWKRRGLAKLLHDYEARRQAEDAADTERTN